MRRITAVLASALVFGVASASAGTERWDGDRPSAERVVFFSGGIPALEITSNRENTACRFEVARTVTTSQRSKAVFAAY
jgi:hypothetical protein